MLRRIAATIVVGVRAAALVGGTTGGAATDPCLDAFTRAHGYTDYSPTGALWAVPYPNRASDYLACGLPIPTELAVVVQPRLAG